MFTEGLEFNPGIVQLPRIVRVEAWMSDENTRDGGNHLSQKVF
jgi:hypothetical protein